MPPKKRNIQFKLAQNIKKQKHLSNMLGQNNPIEVNIRRFILKILATGEATEWDFTASACDLTIYGPL
ncbi:hypothetical protein C1646_761786 [Rhizophagus diaphanus]|nr:hypothetical protein C1646_761786 [Rhizophagus diaphanus] [Rhizophagus sp. MUCL 43196]